MKLIEALFFLWILQFKPEILVICPISMVLNGVIHSMGLLDL